MGIENVSCQPLQVQVAILAWPSEAVPVEEGPVASLARPGETSRMRNDIGPDMEEKRLEAP